MDKETNELLTRTGPETPAGRYMRLFWHPIYRSEDLPSGRAVPVRLMDEDWTLYRGEDGVPHVVAFRCAHRGTRLSVGWVEGDCIRCRYHGWKYDASGQCVEQPGEDESFAEKVRIRSCATEDYLGLIFVYVGEGEPRPMQRFLDFHRPGAVIADPPHTWPMNYFNMMDNDPYHAVWTHRASTIRRTGQPVKRDGLVVAEDTDYGMRDGQRMPDGTVVWGTSSFFPTNVVQLRLYIKETGGSEVREDRLFWYVPVDDTHSLRISTNLVHLTGEAGEQYRAKRQQAENVDPSILYQAAEDVLAGKITIEDLGDRFTHYQQFYIEDYVTEVGQDAIAHREEERLGRNDVKIMLKRRILEREIRLLMDGEPLTPSVSRELWTEEEPWVNRADGR